MERKRWLVILTFQRICKPFIKLCSHELDQFLLLVLIEGSEQLGSKKRIKAKLYVRIFQVTRHEVVFNSFPIDLEFLVWKHKEIRQNTNGLPL